MAGALDSSQSFRRLASAANPFARRGNLYALNGIRISRILESQDFDATDRTRDFLTYIVEEAIAGRADRIKAYAIATAVFGKDRI